MALPVVAITGRPNVGKSNLNVIGVANKADNAKMFPAAAEFTKLGFGEFLCISATDNINKSVLLDMIFRLGHYRKVRS
jgi:predicted GTPase